MKFFYLPLFGKEDIYGDTDVIIGPIANDTLYDTYGIIFSGLVDGDDALRLLEAGNSYTQINVKSEKAASQLKWEKAKKLTDDELSASRNKVKEEEAEFRNAFENALSSLDSFDEIEEIIG